MTIAALRMFLRSCFQNVSWVRLIWSLQVSWQLLFSAPECCVTEWSVGDGWSPWQLARDDSWGGNWEMSPRYECKSLCVLVRIAELAAVMQAVGTVQALYPSKISHSISSNATCHCIVHLHTYSHDCKQAYQTFLKSYQTHIFLFIFIQWTERSVFEHDMYVDTENLYFLSFFCHFSWHDWLDSSCSWLKNVIPSQCVTSESYTGHEDDSGTVKLTEGSCLQPPPFSPALDSALTQFLFHCFHQLSSHFIPEWLDILNPLNAAPILLDVLEIQVF